MDIIANYFSIVGSSNRPLGEIDLCQNLNSKCMPIRMRFSPVCSQKYIQMGDEVGLEMPTFPFNGLITREVSRFTRV